MRGHEIITIYLAAGAPFGAALSLRRVTNHRARRLWALVFGTLLWPCVVGSILRTRILAQDVTAKDEEGVTVTRDSQNFQRARRAERELLHCLHDLEDSHAEVARKLDKNWRRRLLAARGAVEKFAGLTLAASDKRDGLQPGTRETELCRIAGRSGDDLILAGRCAHRRNRRRLARHQACARTELLNALADLKDVCKSLHQASPPDAGLEKFLSEQLLKIYCRAFDLASTLDEHATALAVARLIDDECARLRALESAARSLPHDGMIEAKHL